MENALTICAVPEGRRAMVSFTFDDNTLDHLLVAAPELEKRGWRGTFFVNPHSNNRYVSMHLNWEQIAELHRRGHEIGNHSMSHGHFKKYAAARQWDALAWEISEAERQIREHLGCRPRTYTAPYGETPEFVTRLLAANGVLNTPARDYVGSQTTAEDFARLLEKAAAPEAFTVLMFHGVAPGYGGWEPVVSRDFFCSMLDDWKKREDTLFFGTFQENAFYRERARRAVLEPVEDDCWLLTLPPETMFYNGPVFLRTLQPERQVTVNMLPVQPQANTNVFPVWPGSVVRLR